ncbi:uroporphyrinogen-III C-methyltransferase [Tengunoibacter tsumagoiensis]|uniref:uroporphyrinogen-III C-methyltransferase n=1 Tax=Tengunoibacter tsumagoiensis TaxID=2014871 RepID=A0A402A400_9CHLR|nr:uroporphyrinogen-III C-methyltransferase [Tengunoibacter tsumagoiensis]GCE13789.1 uroporphyrin-III C-methyltransferase [Tengunoibacter tsumagoiensis]
MEVILPQNKMIQPNLADTSSARRPGLVYLIGAGPGDPELITVKGLRALQKAQVVLYDRLIAPELLREAPSDAELIYVGKGADCHTLPQEQINALLVQYAQQGRTVARLKGGDPFVFGRGGEEAQVLAEAGIPFEIIPGISSAIAAPAYAGIPVTHRDYASSVTIVTGHEGKAASPPVNWDALAALGGTLIVLMGVKALPHFTTRLIAGGRSAQTPAAVVQEGTTIRQRVVIGTLEDIAARADAAGLSSPALTVIGAVAHLHDLLAWYEGADQQRNIHE